MLRLVTLAPFLLSEPSFSFVVEEAGGFSVLPWLCHRQCGQTRAVLLEAELRRLSTPEALAPAMMNDAQSIIPIFGESALAAAGFTIAPSQATMRMVAWAQSKESE